MTSTSLEWGMELSSGAGALLWTVFKLARWECISTANISDQVGMACWILAATMLFSRIGISYQRKRFVKGPRSGPNLSEVKMDATESTASFYVE
jgi:hypothetical protein